MRRTILIIHPGALGDILLALPAMRALRAAFPRHALGLIAQGEVSGLLLACEETDRVFPIEGRPLANLLAGIDPIDTEVQRWILDCDVAVAWMADPHHTLESALCKFGVRRILIASPHSAVFRSIHQTDRFLESLRPVVSTSSAGPLLQLPRTVRAEAVTRLAAIGILPSQRLVIIHPGSGSRHKCVDPRVLASLITWYGNNGRVPLVVGGPADVDQVNALQRSCSERFRVLQNLDLLSMAGVIAHADLFVGHDSGLTHLAAGLHVLTVALFGPTDPNRWASRGPHVKVVTGIPCRCQDWEAVRSCADKPCIQISFEQIVSACDSMPTVS